MISGTVTRNREVVIPLDVLAADQTPVSIQVVVGTGFNGFLTLPINVLNSLAAVPAGIRRAELGDGKVVEMDVYFVKVSWRDEDREVLAIQAEATPLVGTALLWDSRVVLDVQEGGVATIDAIPSRE